MEQDLKEKTLERLTSAERILIVSAESSGFDGLASSLGLCLSFQKLGKNVTVIAQPPTVGDARNLYGVNKIGKIGGNQNFVIVIGDAINNVDKVTYFLEKDQLKIVVHPLQGAKGVSRNQVSFEQVSSKPDLIFTIGIRSQEELNKEVIQDQNIDSDIWIVAINNQNSNHKFAQANLVDTQATSLSEIVASFIEELALPVDEDISYNLYSGLSYATNYFSPARTTANSLQVASWLIKFGAGKASFAVTYKNINTTTQDFIGETESPRSPQTGFLKPSTLKPPTMDPQIQQSQKTNVQQLTSTDKPTEEEDWFKPPKIYKGSKSFDTEY